MLRSFDQCAPWVEYKATLARVIEDEAEWETLAADLYNLTQFRALVDVADDRTLSATQLGAAVALARRMDDRVSDLRRIANRLVHS